MTGVVRKMTKQGNQWAVITLEDRDANLEVLFFPAVYQLVAPTLTEDSVVAVRGGADERAARNRLGGEWMDGGLLSDVAAKPQNRPDRLGK
ncbi:OB-fold nucleic acid binding domain-containing protein [Streptomyces sp. NPDC037389]|uniref:OB-fold nucleic acid binding domain-containing protein n=1 Tax=Streptomyces sp. NPDC037389 TaxID=3155369 RepID=UPI0033DE55AE